MQVKMLKHTGAFLPMYATVGSAGADIRVTEGHTLMCGEMFMFPTGLHVEVPEGHVMLIFSRSGLSTKNKLILINGAGVIDSDYRGEVRIPLMNVGPKPVKVEKGDRVAQAVFVPFAQANFHLTESLSETTRGEGGFGHTGVK